RTIAKVFYNDNKYLSKELIKAGLGWWYYQFSENEKLGKLQDEAKTKKIGLWSDVNAISPWEYRKQQRAPYLN
uniref:thermonuclease family protein n=1 Tax=Chryseobacterium sp. TaxID=1871047 RepID=UPI002898C2BC